MNENQTMKEQLEEIKAVLKRLAADGDGKFQDVILDYFLV